jgi:hypothetical protein
MDAVKIHLNDFSLLLTVIIDFQSFKRPFKPIKIFLKLKPINGMAFAR